MYVCTLRSPTQIIWIINISIPFGNYNTQFLKNYVYYEY